MNEFPTAPGRESLDDDLSREKQQVGEAITLNFKEMSRCRVCHRLVTLRRLLREGCCKCGSRAVVPAGFLFERDIQEVEEEYGWEGVTITSIASDQIEAGLLPPGYRASRAEGELPPFDVPETRLHSSERGKLNRANDLKRRLLVPIRAILAVPRILRGCRSVRDVLEGTR